MRLAAIALTACIATTQPVERVDLGPAPPGPWAVLHDALAVCTHDLGIAGEIRVRIAIDPDGGAGAVSAGPDGDVLATCVGRSIARARFPRDHRGRTIEVPFVAG